LWDSQANTRGFSLLVSGQNYRIRTFCFGQEKYVASESNKYILVSNMGWEIGRRRREANTSCSWTEKAREVPGHIK